MSFLRWIYRYMPSAQRRFRHIRVNFIEKVFFFLLFMCIFFSLVALKYIEFEVYGKSISGISGAIPRGGNGNHFMNSTSTTEVNQFWSRKGNTPMEVITEPRRPANHTFSNVSCWHQFVKGIALDALYPRSLPCMPDLLRYMSSAKIVNASIFEWGTQIKFLLRFEDGNEAIAKPMRHPRNFYWGYNKSEPFWLDEERHTAEIASFHLDRVLNFRRAIPCVGRRVNFTSEILHNTYDSGITGTMKKIDGNNCFIGNCVPWFCNEDHPICDRNDLMELSVCLRLPGKIHASTHRWSQGTAEAKVWKNKNVCKEALQNKDVLKGRFFLDTMEVALFDHLIINYDRHNFDRSDLVDLKMGFALINDNGKGFGNPFKDDITFLAPIYQCCRFRNSTFQHLLSLSGRLGKLMKKTLSTDPLAPILTDPFFAALDRRLNQFYGVMEKCLEAYGPEVVFVEKFE